MRGRGGSWISGRSYRALITETFLSSLFLHVVCERTMFRPLFIFFTLSSSVLVTVSIYCVCTCYVVGCVYMSRLFQI